LITVDVSVLSSRTFSFQLISILSSTALLISSESLHVFVAVPGQQPGMMNVLPAGMVPASQVVTLPSGVIPVGTVSPMGLSATMPPQGMMGHLQQQGIVGAVSQPGMTQPQLGVMATVPHTGKIGL